LIILKKATKSMKRVVKLNEFFSVSPTCAIIRVLDYTLYPVGGRRYLE
jgi:hypothetical protein